MATLTQAQATTILRALGWRVRNSAEYTRCVKHFQSGWYLGPRLAEDGKVGPLTSAALLASEKRRRAGSGTASAHFSFTEVACKCNGNYSTCQRIWTKRATFEMMETYRAKSGHPLVVVSGCRCVSRNAAIGGAKSSLHLSGLACDVSPSYSTATVKSWRAATRIGYGASSHKVVHIDRGAGGTLANPLIFKDGR